MTPTTLVCGFLGIGKTTAILDALARRPDGERWAVLVNEFGEIGLDGAVLDAAGGFDVREVPGGCICCSAGLALRANLVKLLREVRPDRLLIEPTGLAHPASIIDMLRSPGIREAIDERATITLVDPRHVRQERYLTHDTWRDQVRIADVLVANRSDLASPEDLDAFDAWAQALEPPPIVVAHTTHGALDPAWLALRPSPREIQPMHHHPHAESGGWVFPPEVVFDRRKLETALQGLARTPGLLRLKGIFRTPRVWLRADATPDLMRFEGINHRRDSRVEVVCEHALDWDAIRASLVAATRE